MPQAKKHARQREKSISSPKRKKVATAGQPILWKKRPPPYSTGGKRGIVCGEAGAVRRSHGETTYQKSTRKRRARLVKKNPEKGTSKETASYNTQKGNTSIRQGEELLRPKLVPKRGNSPLQ